MLRYVTRINNSCIKLDVVTLLVPFFHLNSIYIFISTQHCYTAIQIQISNYSIVNVYFCKGQIFGLYVYNIVFESFDSMNPFISDTKNVTLCLSFLLNFSILNLVFCEAFLMFSPCMCGFLLSFLVSSAVQIYVDRVLNIRIVNNKYSLKYSRLLLVN